MVGSFILLAPENIATAFCFQIFLFLIKQCPRYLDLLFDMDLIVPNFFLYCTANFCVSFLGCFPPSSKALIPQTCYLISSQSCASHYDRESNRINVYLNFCWFSCLSRDGRRRDNDRSRIDDRYYPSSRDISTRYSR